MTIKNIINYRSRDIILILVIWMVLDQNPFNEFIHLRSFSMTRIVILEFQSVGFGREEGSLSLKVEDKFNNKK